MVKRPQNDPYGFVGSTLAGRYEIQELLGMGGMAVVYRARHLVTTRTLAVKILKPDQVYANPKIAEYFLNEAKATANLNHRNIVAVSDADTDEDGTAFLVMEYLPGISLEDELRETEEFLPLDRIATLFEQICDGVDHAHENRILHRDLKPGNIMIVRDERGEEQVKILDFGIAKALRATANVSMIIGTLTYASPEQLNKGAFIDHRSDIYSLGVILYEMITRAVPFEEETQEQFLYQEKMNFVLPSMRRIRPEISLEVEDVIRRSLEREPGRRFQTAAEMARAFWRALKIETGFVSVSCENAETRVPMNGVSIILNGKYAGQTDAAGQWSQKGLSPKKYLIEIESPGFRHFQTQINVEPNATATIPVTLEREPVGELIIKTNVRGAAVELDGKPVGVTNEYNLIHLEGVRSGAHRVRLSFPKHEPVEAEVKVATAEITAITRAMNSKPQFEWKKWAAVATVAVSLFLVGYAIYSLFSSGSGRGKLAQRSKSDPTQGLSSNVIEKPVVAPQVSPTVASATSVEPAPAPVPAAFEEEMALANQFLAKNELEKAAERFEAARAIQPADAKAISGLNQIYNKLGQLYSSKKQWPQAVEIYQKAVKLIPSSAALQEKLGDAYIELPDSGKAAKAYDEAIRLGRNDGGMNYKAGAAYLVGRRYSEAASRCGRAADFDKNSRDALLCEGAAQERRGKFDEALKAYKNVRDLDRNNKRSDGQIVYNIGRIYVKKRNKKEAENAVNELVKLRSPYAKRLAYEVTVGMR
jgi:serine/threonine protein kinase/Flp pilus assembly protein TadD